MQSSLSQKIALSILLMSGASYTVSNAAAQTSSCTPPSGFTAIRTQADFEKIRSNPAGKFFLCNNVIFSGTFNPIAQFKGQLDGNQKRLQQLRISDPVTETQTGLFREIVSGGVVKKLTVTNFNIRGNDNTGVIAGKSSGLLENITLNSGTVSGRDAIGGIVGYSHLGMVRYATASSIQVFGTNSVGGLIGRSIGGGLLYANLSNSQIRGADYVGGAVGNQEFGGVQSVNTSGTSVIGADYVGGLTGRAFSTVTFRSRVSGAVQGKKFVGGLLGYFYPPYDPILDPPSVASSSANLVWGLTGEYGVGGLIGLSEGSFENCYARGTLRGLNFLGGLVGIGATRIQKSYSTVALPKTCPAGAGVCTIGGIVGLQYQPLSIFDTFFDSTINPTLKVQGDAIPLTGNAQPKTTTQLKNINTYTAAGWNISLISNTAKTMWKMGAATNFSTPELQQ